MKLTWQCMFAPRLYKIYKDGSRESMYQSVGMEKWGDKVISVAYILMKLGLYTSPFICFYKRGTLTFAEAQTAVRYLGGISCLIAISYIIRGIGRAGNPKYVEFLKVFKSPMTDEKAYLQAIRKYDFDFKFWPATYVLSPKERARWSHPFASCANQDLPLYKRTIIQVLAFVATHTFALRIIYPGSLGLVQNLISSALFEGRTYLVEAFDGKRTKIKTADGNFLDTMFVDNREQGPKGKNLVICCEGNSGFYEVGIMASPAKAGYSALGWNHPGFAGSTGLPYPDQEQNAIDAVMRFAINELGFEPAQIVLFGWSIGGYSAAWAAANYPDVKGLILDATFDDLLPLAVNQMPSSWGLLVKEVVRTHVNLHVAEVVAKYPGPVQLVRRTEDEIICLQPGVLASNRGNDLLLSVVRSRHPELPAPALATLRQHAALTDQQRRAIERTGGAAPLRLISKYMRDYKSTHCAPLPEDEFDTVMANLTAKQ